MPRTLLITSVVVGLLLAVVVFVASPHEAWSAAAQAALVGAVIPLLAGTLLKGVTP